MKQRLTTAVAGAFLLLYCLQVLACGNAVRVMTFNAWGGGANDGTGPDQTIAAIRAADADLVGLQEVRAEGASCVAGDCPAEGAGFAAAAASALGYHLVEQNGPSALVWANAILSRHPVIATSPKGAGALFEVDGRRVVLFNVHLDDYPYQPYQAAGIPYGEAPFLNRAEDLVRAAIQARGQAVELLHAELGFAADADLAVITGDFNEPSHRDWSMAAADLGRHPLAVEYPSILALEALGFVDAFRAFHPDEIAHPGFTWTPTAPPDDRGEHHDRIDFVLFRGAGVRVGGAWVIGESSGRADIVVRPWPSDHRAVVAEIEFAEACGPD